MSLRTVVIALAVSPLVAPGQPSVRPWPIGSGPAYRPAPAPAAVQVGAPLGGFRCGTPGSVFALHLEIFADQRAVLVPAGIGVATQPLPSGRSLARPRCTYPLSTRTPAGIVDVARGRVLHLGDLFRIWGQPLGANRIASFHSASPVRVYVDGHRVRGAVAAIPLGQHAEIVLELGAYVPPHPFFLFAEGES